ncbi:8227_t:CDS:2 [Scutellospora calospora]|uniref:8227_t:CDS:1 n=1 Tax=Scutellospora calospora TaxID=85575 RepID=A0ACA9JVG3_9GLOM|nr:8227_t:CDS:2 [Scutellospora calospora]
MSLPQKSCYISHYLIYKLMIDKSYNSVLILEDDVDFELNVTAIMTDIYRDLPASWELSLLYVGHCFEYVGKQVGKSSFVHRLYKSNMYATHAYAVSYSGANKLVDLLDPVTPHGTVNYSLRVVVRKGSISSYSVHPQPIFCKVGYALIEHEPARHDSESNAKNRQTLNRFSGAGCLEKRKIKPKAQEQTLHTPPTRAAALVPRKRKLTLSETDNPKRKMSKTHDTRSKSKNKENEDTTIIIKKKTSEVTECVPQSKTDSNSTNKQTRSWAEECKQINTEEGMSNSDTMIENSTLVTNESTKNSPEMASEGSAELETARSNEPLGQIVDDSDREDNLKFKKRKRTQQAEDPSTLSPQKEEGRETPNYDKKDTEIDKEKGQDKNFLNDQQDSSQELTREITFPETIELQQTTEIELVETGPAEATEPRTLCETTFGQTSIDAESLEENDGFTTVKNKKQRKSEKKNA